MIISSESIGVSPTKHKRLSRSIYVSLFGRRGIGKEIGRGENENGGTTEDTEDKLVMILQVF